MTAQPSTLEDQAREHADALTATVRAIAPECDEFTATVVGERFVVQQSPSEGIPLCVDGAELLTIKVRQYYEYDSHNQFLATHESLIKVWGGRAQGEPLFRYEYERNAVDKPSAHIQIHAHRDAFSYVMDRAGAASRRGRRRSQSTGIQRLQDLHFPLGGHRFRPCLEDVLEMLVTEFGVDCSPQGVQALHDGRERWRRIQTRTVVRDAPEEAVTTLEHLGYRIEKPHANTDRSERVERLRDF